MRLIHLFIAVIVLFTGCLPHRTVELEPLTIRTMHGQPARTIEIEFQKGKAFNHPSFAVWLEDLEGNYIETLYVTAYVAKGIYGHGQLAPGRWSDQPGEARRPATLPYWAHKRNIPAPDGLYIPSPSTAVPDALTSATPRSDFRIEAASGYDKPGKFRILLEINQAWDANDYWTNGKYNGDLNYFGSLQPALVYAVTLDPANDTREYHLNPIGHSHPTGENGELFTDLTTLTTAKEMAHKIIVRLK